MTDPDRHDDDDEDDGPTRVVGPGPEDEPPTVARVSPVRVVGPGPEDEPPTVGHVPSARRVLVDTVREPVRPLAPPGEPPPPDDTIRVGPRPPTSRLLADGPFLRPDLEAERPTLKSSFAEALAEIAGPSHDLAHESSPGVRSIPPVIVSSELTPCSPPPDLVPSPPATPPEITRELSVRDVEPIVPPPVPSVAHQPAPLPTPSPSRVVPDREPPPRVEGRLSPIALIAVCSGFSLLVGIGLGALLMPGREGAEPALRPGPGNVRAAEPPPAVSPSAPVEPGAGVQATEVARPAPAAAPTQQLPAPAGGPDATAGFAGPPATARPGAAVKATTPSPRTAARPPTRPRSAGSPPARPPRPSARAQKTAPRPAEPPRVRGAGGFVRDNPF